MSYPIDNLLRPPVELYSAGTLFVGSAMLAATPPWVPVSAPTAMALSLGLLVGALWRGRQAWTVLRYQRNLRTLRRYSLKPSEIPWSNEVLYLGMGFRWTALHTQRLHQAQLPKNRRYAEQTRLYKAIRRFELTAEHDPRPRIQQLRTLFRQEAWWNRWKPLPDVGGNPALHGVEPDEEQVSMPLSGRVGHILVLGTTRVGKTRLAEVLITQDIRRGDVVVAFDPKGDADLMIRMYVEAHRAGRPFYVFHLGFPHISARYNPIGSFSRITEVATRTADPLPSEGNSAAFKEFVWRFVNVLAKAMTTLGERPDFQSIYAYAVDTESLAVRYFTWWLDRVRPGWKQEVDALEASQAKALAEGAKKSGRSTSTLAILGFIRDNDLRDPVADALRSVLSNDRTYFEKLVSSLYPLLEKLTTGKIADLISPDYTALDDPRPIIDWMNIINHGAVVYVGLDSLSDHEVAGAIGTSMFADLTSVAGQIYKFGVGVGQLPPGRRRLALHADEFNELVGDAFIPMVNKGGGAGYQVTAYTQTWHDVEAKVGDAAKAMQIGGNFNTRVMLRVENTETAEILTEKLPEVEVPSMQVASMASDSNDPTDFAEFQSRNEDRITIERLPMLTPADLVQLPKGQAFALINGGQLWKVRFPLADTLNESGIPADIEEMAHQMRAAQLAHGRASDAGITVMGKGSGW
ncbi:type IV conjugative transfer system coupling protein TraD [Parasulfuritortus cantonensis]|uniref:Type IV conjugative transfer system coupling protein TraD n=1 Tax=Parasulfuritortus cantonensis TaxID=2528202 RepID=A0A4R1BR06_9PROT|nr:type IV conjugative transfer system coupling protein TraD [Parasulfuritortus cantonensis]TCJ20183.1 type IV conjugative transfer system coupling protein TraD [Parasulfuritortus cantonensis]